MKGQSDFSSSDIAAYVLGQLPAEAAAQLHKAAQKSSTLRAEISAVSASLDQLAMAQAQTPPPALKSRLMDALSDNWAPDALPRLDQSQDLSRWRKFAAQYQEPADYENIFALPVGKRAGFSWTLVWAKKGLDPEVHTRTLEKFMVLDGSCDIVLGETTHQLQAGDTIEIPLHITHSVKVTSRKPLLIVLQRNQAA